MNFTSNGFLELMSKLKIRNLQFFLSPHPPMPVEKNGNLRIVKDKLGLSQGGIFTGNQVPTKSLYSHKIFAAFHAVLAQI